MKHKVGLVGCGNISTTYLKNAALFNNFEFLAVADLEPERAKAKAEEFGLRALSVAELMHSDAELILNLTIPAAHAEIAQQALESGKHAYNEKPLAIELGDAQKMLELAKAKGLRLGCAPDTFLGAGLQTAREILDSGQLGQAVGASAAMITLGPEKWHPDPEFFFKRGAGPLFDMGPYYLTALVHLFGPLARVMASARRTFAERTVGRGAKAGQTISVETPTHISALLEFASGLSATLTVSFDGVRGDAPNIEVYGTGGALVVGDPNMFSNPLKQRFAGEGWNISDWQPIEITRPYAENSRGAGVADLFAGIDENRPHRASGELAYHVLEAMHNILQSAQDERWIPMQSSAPRPQPLPKAVNL